MGGHRVRHAGRWAWTLFYATNTKSVLFPVMLWSATGQTNGTLGSCICAVKKTPPRLPKPINGVGKSCLVRACFSARGAVVWHGIESVGCSCCSSALWLL